MTTTASAEIPNTLSLQATLNHWTRFLQKSAVTTLFLSDYCWCCASESSGVVVILCNYLPLCSFLSRFCVVLSRMYPLANSRIAPRNFSTLWLARGQFTCDVYWILFYFIFCALMMSSKYYTPASVQSNKLIVDPVLPLICCVWQTLPS